SARSRGREPGDAAHHVALGVRHAAGRAESVHRSGGGEGRRHHVRAIDPGAGARAARHRADARHRLRPPAGARLHHAGGAVVLAARGHAGGAARHPRARAGPAMSTLLADTVTRLLTDLVTKDAIESAEKGVWPEK